MNADDAEAGLPRAFYQRSTIAAARGLLGQRLVRTLNDGTRLAGVIVETEAYLGPEDKAAHTFGWRRTARTEAMFMTAGTAYVFLTYGIHHCLNFSTVGADVPQAVLVRALEAVEGLDAMRGVRHAAKKDVDLCNGPGKLTQALQITAGLDRHDTVGSTQLTVERLRSRVLPNRAIATGPRIGVDYAQEWAAAPLRFWMKDHVCVSRG